MFGCDSVQTAVHGGRLHWAWGDTTLPGYPLGVFDTTSATTSVGTEIPKSGLAPLA